MDQVEFMATQQPASNAYSPNDKLKSQIARSPNAHMNRDASPKTATYMGKDKKIPAPNQYEVEKIWKKQSVHRTTSFTYSVPRSSRPSFIDQTQKAKSKVPQPGHYKNDGIDQFSKLSRGLTIPHYKRGR